MVGQKRPKMVRYSKLVICNDYDIGGVRPASPPPVTHFLCYDTCTTIAQTLRYLQLVSRIHELMMKLKLWATHCCKTIYINPSIIVLDTTI